MLTTLFSTVLAGTTVDLNPSGTAFQNPRGFDIDQILNAVITLVFIVGGVVFFFMLVWGGISWIMSGGDKAKTEGARNRITAALVGLIVLFSAWAIVQLIQTFLGVDILGGLAVPVIGE